MKLLRGLSFTLAVVLVVLTGNGSSRSQEGPWARAETVQARLLSAVAAVGELDRIRAGLHVELVDGWRTYWRSPGVAGLPPRVDWSGSSNVEEVGFRWPAPQRFEFFGFDNFGYEKEVVFPLDVVPDVRRCVPAQRSPPPSRTNERLQRSSVLCRATGAHGQTRAERC